MQVSGKPSQENSSISGGGRYQREAELLQKISNAYLNLKEEEVYSELIHLMVEELHGDFGFFGYVEEHGELVCHTSSTNKERGTSRDVLWLKESQWKELWGYIADKDEVRILEDSNDAGSNKISNRAGNYLSGPLFFRETFIGLIQIQSDKKIGGPERICLGTIHLKR